MNCKQGDLAVIVRSYYPQFVGRIVTVLCPYSGPLYGNGWVVEMQGEGQGHCDDDCLRPIRDNDGEDETLTRAGKPELVTA